MTVVVGSGLILVLPRIGALMSAGLGAASVVAAFGTSWIAFSQAQLLIDPVYPWVVITLVYLVLAIMLRRLLAFTGRGLLAGRSR